MDTKHVNDINIIIGFYLLSRVQFLNPNWLEKGLD